MTGVTLETTGIESEVVDGDLEPIGHVAMLDYDDVPIGTVLEEIEALEGPAVLSRSSPGSWHVVDLEVRPFAEAIEVARSSTASREFVSEMDRRGCLTLRIGPKRRPDGSVETPAPVPITVHVPDGLEEVEVSRPHAGRLRQLAANVGVEHVEDRLEEIERGAVDGLEPVGRQLPETRYETRGGIR
ncbi:hypothetical protein [Streptomyces thermoalcalitolerans]